jgi:probable phosphoglycerate mutase
MKSTARTDFARATFEALKPMLQLLLVRSGCTEYDQQGRIQGTLDVPLSEDGRREAEVVTEALRSQTLDAIYSSPCQAARHVADKLAEAADVKPKVVDQLHNLDHGLWQGMLVDDVKAKQPKVYRQWQEQPETVCPPQGETVRAAKARVAGVVAKLIKKHKGAKQVAVVVPEPLASVVRHVLKQDDLGDLWHCAGGTAAPPWEFIQVEPHLVGAK